MTILSFIPLTPSPSKTLKAIAPLLDAISPVLGARITSPQPPSWMDEEMVSYLLSLSDDQLVNSERTTALTQQRDKKLPRMLKYMYSLTEPLQYAFPCFPVANELLTSPVGRSLRRSKSRPRSSKRAQLRAVSLILSEVLRQTRSPVSRVIDIGAGHGHLSAQLAAELDPGIQVIAVERNPQFVQTATSVHISGCCTPTSPPTSHSRAPLSFVKADVVPSGSNLPLVKGNALVGLHACGALGDALISGAGQQEASAVLLVSCCLQKIAPGATSRPPLSFTSLNDDTLRKHLTLTRSQLGATNASRGYNRHGDLVARETRYALRVLLADSGHSVERVGEEVVGISRHSLRAGLHAIVPELVELYGIDIPSNEDIIHRVLQAKVDYRVMRALTLPRAFAASILEMAVVLDRAACLEDAGFRVSTGRIWPDEVSPRNLCCVAWR